MGSDDAIDLPRKRRRISPPETGPYVLRPLVDKVPVEAEDGGDAHITAVDYWNDNLYIGTSAGEIIHFVSLPPDPSADATAPEFMLASKQPITNDDDNSTSTTGPGVQRILILPTPNKACILCNGTVTFYSLPELSPAYGGSMKVPNCSWIGGLDLNNSGSHGQEAAESVIMIAARNKIRLVRIGEEARLMRNIEYPGCLTAARRDTIACVADSHSYALLEVEHRQKISLFSISSSEEYFETGHVETIPRRSISPGPVSNGHTRYSENRGHGRSTSLNTLTGSASSRQASPQPGISEISGSGTPDSFTDGNFLKPGYPPERRASVPGKPASSSSVESSQQKPLPPPPKPAVSNLKPHILSPTPSEFLLTTGTGLSDPGVGMFVNLEGETAERGTMEFQRYPEAMVLDDYSEDNEPRHSNDAQEGFVLAIIEVEDGDGPHKYLEAQRWDLDPGEGARRKALIEIPSNDATSAPAGIHRTTGSSETCFTDVGEVMQIVRLKVPKALPSETSTPSDNTDPRTKASIEQLQKEKELFENQETDSDGSRPPTNRLKDGWELERNREEAEFARTLGRSKGNLILWKGNQIWSILRNPLTVQLENSLQLTQQVDDVTNFEAADKKSLVRLAHNLDNVVPKSGFESLGLNYVKQKTSLLLFADLISSKEDIQTEDSIRTVEASLVTGELDPRIILLLTPLLKEEVLEGPQGIWLYAGLAKVVEAMTKFPETQNGDCAVFTFSNQVLLLIMRYLMSWQRKRGYGSVTDDAFVFDSVDSALLHLLLELDSRDIQARGAPGRPALRTEINKLVDNWKGNFNRAVQLLESYQRLFVLSRLYQSRKMSGYVLRTWRRIIEGEKDNGGELSIPATEVQVRKYLVKIRDSQLVEDYAVWLCARNPQLGVQIFADDSSRAKFDPAQVIPLLKERAPAGVQVYLEHLVFAKNITQYSDDLIAYYLDTVLSVLETSPEARSSLAESYSTYRALRPPKPSYLSFITQNAPPEAWWQSRLRLLQLLGGGVRSQFTSTKAIPTDLPYSIPMVLERIEPFKNELVSECIILGGRQGRHHDALHLLTHGLGDYDSAVRYCLFSGSTTASEYPADIPPMSTSSSSTQKELFAQLLQEFLKISDPSDRAERTSDLLARFAPLYDVREVLDQVPGDWGVDVLSDFLARVLRDLVSEGRSARVQRALSAGLNLRISAEFLQGAEKVGGWVDDGNEIRPLKGGEDEVEAGAGAGVGDGGGDGDGDEGDAGTPAESILI